jgi:DNA-binding MarR family transcriptional regulator
MKNFVKTNTHLNESAEDATVSIFRDIMRARHILREKANQVAAESNLHVAEMNVVDILGKFGPVSMGRLSRETFISPSNTTSTVKKLEKNGLVVREKSEASDREVKVSLTNNGRAVFRKCYPQILGEAHDYIADRMTRKEQKIFQQLLEKLAH